MAQQNHNYALIMAGGVGSRFWPTSRTTFPKQFQDLTGEGKSLLQQTVDRLTGIIPFDQIYVLTNACYQSIVQKQLPSLTPSQIICEPVMRNTAPCILYAALKIHQLDPQGTMLVLPSDHFIGSISSYRKDVELALDRASQEEALLTFGIPPVSPHTGYGYLAVKSKEEKITEIQQFTEKPDEEKAKEFLASGKYFWNSGMFVWSCATILTAFAAHQPTMLSLFNRGDEVLGKAEEEAFLAQQYPKAANVSIDYAILEKAKNIAMVKASFQWNDLGTWSSLHDQLAANTTDNTTVNAHLITKEAKGNMIYTSKEKLVVLKGLDNYVVVEEDDVLLIYPKGEDQSIKVLRNRAKEQFGEDIA